VEKFESIFQKIDYVGMFLSTEISSEVDIINSTELEFKNPLIVMGFVGAGLVGEIAVNHLIDQLNMREIAHIRSKHIPPSVVFVEGKLKNPFRIYSNNEGTLCTVICEVPLRSDSLYPLASKILDWAENNKAKEVIVLEGLPVRGLPKKRPAFCASEPEKRKECEDKGIKMLSARIIISGIAGSILSGCLTRKITGVTFLTPAIAFMPDTEGAATLVDTLNKVYDLKVDTKKLLDQAADIKSRLKEIAQSYQKMRKDEDKRGASLDKLYT